MKRGERDLRCNKDTIAIVGMACRFPGGASSPAAFWNCLREGRDLVTEIDGSRWSKEYYYHPNPRTPGRSYTWSAGVLGDVDRFDADFFGISPREANEMDPQQRILLELAWEALEDGGQVPERLAGSDCAVYIGISGTDYANSRVDDPGSGNAYAMTGGTLSIAANRISYVFDLHGPSMAVDTACSSSLVALHQACQSIRRGESATALAGGVNLLMTPFNFIGFSKASMLSPSGRSRAFDAAGDGYVRSEGGAVVFLKPLLQARRDGDPIHALILGSAVNSDGRTRGLSMPNTRAQAELLESAYRNAGVDPADLAYVEAHGTGTAAGDPREASALGSVLAARREAGDPLPIGSAKTNLGHLEPASGMAGLLKAVLCLKHRAIPASLHFTAPNPDIPFDELNLEVVSRYTELPASGKPALLGVNSFGFGGTNAHVVLGEHPPPAAPSSRSAAARRKRIILFLSARNPGALPDLAAGYRRLLLDPGAPPVHDVAHNAALRRQWHDHRLAVVGDDPAELARRLEVFRTEGRCDGVASGQVLGRRVRLALVFSGNGSQWAGMGRRLLAQDRRFRRAVGAVDALIRDTSGFSVIEEFRAGQEESRLHLTEYAQPALFALQVGLFESLATRGVEPEAVLGHSVGEVAAAYACGAFDLEQAVRVIHERSRAQAPTRGQGRMAALGLPPARAIAAIESYGGEIELAAVNSPSSVTLSGPLAALRELGEALEGSGTFFRILDLDYAFHSRVMDPIRDGLLAALSGLRPGPTRLRFVSSVTGGSSAGEALGPRYWWDNIRRPVRFDKALATLAGDGFGLFLEVGPHPIMQGYLHENLRTAKAPGRPLATLRRDADGVDRVWEALASLYVHGARFDLSRLFKGRPRPVSLPAYPWQKESYWYQSTDEELGVRGERLDHPLLGYPVRNATGEWRNHVDAERIPYLADHVVGGAVVFPAAAFIEMAIAASRLRYDGARHVIENFEIRTPLLLAPGEEKTLRFRLDEEGDFAISSRTRLSGDSWTHHASGKLAGVPARGRSDRLDVEAGIAACPRHYHAEDHYRITKALGLDYGPAFRGVAKICCGADTGWARIVAGAGTTGEDRDRYHLHPCRLDPCLQMLASICAGTAGRREPAFLPVQFGRLVFHGSPGETCHCRAAVTRKNARSLLADFTLVDGNGYALVQMEDFRFRRMPLKREGGARAVRYVFGTELRPRDGERNGEYLPRPTSVAEQLVPRITEQWFVQRRSDYYDQVLPLFDALSSAFVYRAFRQTLGSRSRFTLHSLLGALRADPSHAPYLQRLVLLLEEDGMAERDGSQWRLAGASELSSAEEIWRLVLADFPVYLPESVVAGRAGLHLPEVLKGRRNAAGILFPEKGASAKEYLLDVSPAMRIGHYATREALAAIIADWPAGRRLRILEIGAGATGLSAELLSLAPPERCDYVFASPDPALRSRAETMFGQRRAFSVADIDLGIPTSGQDLCPNRYDVVIASHALHEFTDLDIALSVIRWLLVCDGLLLLLERPPERLSDLVFGLQPRWWARSPSSERPRSRLLREEEWCGVLERLGFTEAVPLSEPAPNVDASSFLIVARNPVHDEVMSDAALPERKVWLLLAGAEGAAPVSGYLVDTLRAGGHRVIVASSGTGFGRLHADGFVLDPTRPEGFERLFATLADEGVHCDGIVHLMGLRLDESESATGLEVSRTRSLSAMYAARAVAADTAPPRLWLITCGAFPIDAASGSRPHLPSQGAFAGIGRVLANEHPGLRCRIVDVAPEGAPVAARLVAAEVLDPDDEDEVLADAQARYGVRLDRLEAFPAPPQVDEGGSAKSRRALRLDFAVPGPLGNLCWYEEERKAPGPGEIEIRVRATGLNFRDVMYAMGMLTDDAVEGGFAGATLGMECAGDVVEVGRDVTGFKAGDPVVCFARACFGTFVTTETTAVAHKPAGWTYEEAATVPSVFFTVYYALHHLADLQRGERILIHGAAGGVGMAAIQQARYLGAEIFATAGSPQKRDFLRLLGVEHVFDSRGLAFADEIMDLTNGTGVDVVLNSLSGPAMRRSLDLLKPFGRFLELGKRDFYENAKVGLRPFRNNVSYHGIDADYLLAGRNALAGSLFRRMMGLFEQGAFRPLVHQTFPARRIVEAFRCMQQSEHIGKVVVNYEDSDSITPARRAPVPSSALVLAPDASYLVTGGLGGFGLATAAWLVEKGARQLVLAGRNGAATREAREGVKALCAAGARVEVCKVDVREHGALERMMQRVDREFAPLRGVVHAAMVLDDRLIAQQNAESFDKAFDPKAKGAWNLHALTRDRDLDFFVLFSSVTTCFGNPGQANYVAGNMYLECLAQHRRALGLPALAVGFGPIGDAGYLARNKQIREALAARTGSEALRARQALNELEGLMSEGRSGVTVAALDWQALRHTLPALRSRRFERIGEFGGGRGERDDIREVIADLPEGEAHEKVTGLLSEQVAKVLRLPAERLDLDTSIYDLGMDSLMAVELHMAVEEQFNVHVPAMAMTEGMSITQLAGRIAGQLRGRGAAAPESDLMAKLALRHGESLDAEEIDRFIASMNAPRQPRRSAS